MTLISPCISRSKNLIEKWLLIVCYQLSSKCEGKCSWKDQRKPEVPSNVEGKMTEIGDNGGKTAPLSSQGELPDGKTKGRIEFSRSILVSVGQDKVESDQWEKKELKWNAKIARRIVGNFSTRILETSGQIRAARLYIFSLHICAAPLYIMLFILIQTTPHLLLQFSIKRKQVLVCHILCFPK